MNKMTKANNIRFRLLYDKLLQPLYRFVYFKCGDESLAQDVVQDVFLKLWSKIDDIDDETASAYCYTAAKNTLINKLEKLASKKKYQHTIKLDTPTQNPQQELIDKEFSKYVSDIISMLPDIQREVFLMSRVEKLKYSEIAERLQIGQKAVEKRMSLALKKIKIEIEKYQSQ